MNLLIVLSAVCQVESAGIHTAVNIMDGGSASYGFCQIKIATARRLGYRGPITALWFDKQVNKKVALDYLKWQATRYPTMEQIIAAYNSGSVKRKKNGQFINQDYVNKVFQQMKKENKNYVEVQGW